MGESRSVTISPFYRSFSYQARKEEGRCHQMGCHVFELKGKSPLCASRPMFPFISFKVHWFQFSCRNWQDYYCIMSLHRYPISISERLIFYVKVETQRKRMHRDPNMDIIILLSLDRCRVSQNRRSDVSYGGDLTIKGVVIRSYSHNLINLINLSTKYSMVERARCCDRQLECSKRLVPPLSVPRTVKHFYNESDLPNSLFLYGKLANFPCNEFVIYFKKFC